MYGSKWVLNGNFQSELEYGHTMQDAMVRPSENIIYADDPIPRVASCLEDVWQYPVPDPMVKMPSKIKKKD